MFTPLLQRLRRSKSKRLDTSKSQESPGTNTSQPITDTTTHTRDRHGLFLLGEGKAPEAGKETYGVDIVAIHGLNGDAYSTWEHNNGTLWLRDLLPDDLPGSRVFTYGYPSGLFFSKSTAGLKEYARGLLVALRNVSEENAERPIIFVCHSLGGIVCKQAVVTAHEESHWYSSILASTTAIVFLGTPHRGARGTPDIGKAVGGVINACQHLSLTAGAGVVRTDLLDTLSSNSTALKDLATSFRNRIDSFDIVTFHETESMPPMSYKIVDEDSAIMDVPKEEIIPLYENHVAMCRFAGRTTGYDLVSKAIERLARKACRNKLSKNSGTVESSERSLTDTEKSCMRLFNAIEFGDSKAKLPKPVEGTCSWVLSCPQYRSWVAKEETTLLWITGDPGCGKTTLSAYLAEHLSYCSWDQSRAQVCFFFCDETITKQRDARSIIRCVVYQILQRHRSLIKHVKARYDIDGVALVDSFQALWEIFLRMVADSRFDTIDVIVDAIDECEQATRRIFLDAITNLVHSYQKTGQGARCHIKFLITSRPSLGDSYDFNGLAKTRLPMEQNQSSITEDVRLVIKRRVEQIVQKSQNSDEMKAYLEDALYSRADQTFLWVDIVLRHLEGSLLASKKDFEQIIEEFPLDLEETYAGFLRRIPHHKIGTAKILRLIVGSFRHLDLMEINIAFTINYNHRTVASVSTDCQPSMARTIHGLTGSLARATGSKVSLIHQTVKEFLTKLALRSDCVLAQDYGVDPAEAALNLACACIWYLSLRDFETDLFSDSRSSFETVSPGSPTLAWAFQIQPDSLEDDEIFKDAPTRDAEICVSLGQQYAFFDYAATHWGEHLSVCQHIAPKHVHETVTLITKKGSCVLKNWLRYFWFKMDMEFSFPEYFDTILVAAIFDLSIVLRDSLERDPCDQSTKDLALFWAARMGRARSTEVLLLHGANPNCRGPDQYRSPLIVAAQHGYLPVVDALLFNKRTDINMKGESGRSALSFAAGNGQRDIVLALLKLQVYDGNDSDNSRWKPLFWAVEGNHTNIIGDLLQHIPEQINHTDKSGRSAISWAAGDGLLQPLRILLKHPGSDPNLADSTRRSPLSWAASSGHTEVVRLLLRNSAVDKSIEDTDGRNVISWACQGGHTDTVKTLIRYGCPGVDKADVDGWAPLAWALFSRSLATVEALIGSGKVNINRRDGNGRSALWYAACYGYLEVVQFLLLEGAEAEVVDNEGQTPVSMARTYGLAEVVEVLEAQ